MQHKYPSLSSISAYQQRRDHINKSMYWNWKQLPHSNLLKVMLLETI